MTEERDFTPGQNEGEESEEEQPGTESNKDDVEEGKGWKKKALIEFRCRVEDAILNRYIVGRKMGEKDSCVRWEESENLEDITLWGVPLLPSKAHGGTDIVLSKFLVFKDFKVSDAFNMLRRTLRWRKKFGVDDIENDDSATHLHDVICTSGTDRDGRPLFYSVYGAFRDKDLYKRTFGRKENSQEFLRCSVRAMEKAIQRLTFKPGGVHSLVRITDLKNWPCPAGCPELRSASMETFHVFQENYPELIHKHIIINVPFWDFCFQVLQSPFLNQRTRSQFVFARSSKVAKTLLKYIAPENVPIQYGGLKEEGDEEFSANHTVHELVLRGNAIYTIRIPVKEVAVTAVWDVSVIGRGVMYREEFVPEDDGSYNVLLKEWKKKKIGEGVRNSFYISEPGHILITMDNDSYKKRIAFYRYKTKPTQPLFSLFPASL